MNSPITTSCNAQPLLWLHELGAGYGDRVVLDGIELELPHHGLWSVMGPPGVGKSTLLRIICGVAQQNANLKIWGEMRYQGLLAGEQGWPSLLGQDARLMVSTVLENLACGLPDRSRLNLAAQRERILQHLESMGCADLGDGFDRQVIELDLASQRMVAILRQTLPAPIMLCADEPTAGLEEAEADRLLRLLRRCAGSCLVLLATHHQRTAREHSDQVVLLASGRIQEAGSPDEFFNRPLSAAAREFVDRGSCTSVRPDARQEELDSTVVALPPLSSRASRAMNAWAGPRGFVWLRTGRLAGTPMPGVVGEVEHDLDALQRVGVTRLLTLLERPLTCNDELADRNIEALHVPIDDMTAPGLAQAEALCRQIDTWLEEGQVVAVHCLAGHGRTGTMLAAWCIWHGESAPEAIEGVRQLERRWIQSKEQADFLQEFEIHLRSIHPARSQFMRDTTGFD